MNREGKKWAVNSFTVRGISETALLSVLIAVSGFFKIPGFVPGSECSHCSGSLRGLRGRKIHSGRTYCFRPQSCFGNSFHFKCPCSHDVPSGGRSGVDIFGKQKDILYFFGTIGNHGRERSHIIDFGKRILCSCCRRFSRDDFYYDFVLFFCRIDRAVPVKK